MPRYATARQLSNYQAQRALDADAADQEKGSVAMERLQLDREKAAALSSFREAELARKAEAGAQRAALAEGRFGIAQSAAELAQKQAEVIQKSRELEQLQAQRKLDTSAEILDQATGFLRDARGMRPTAPQFDEQLQNMLAGYPQAAEHPAVKEWLGYHTDQRKAYLATQAEITKAKAAPATVAETTETIPDQLDPTKMLTSTKRTVTTHVPSEELKRNTPMSGKAFLETIKR